MVSETSSEYLVVQAQLGDRAALSELVHRFHDQVWTFLRHLTADRSLADDLAQETWLRALRGLAGLRNPDRFPAWLLTIARRAATDQLRGTYRWQALVDVDSGHDELDGIADSSDRLATADRLDLVASIEQLHPQLRVVVWLFYYLGLPVSEIAPVLDVPPGTVKSRLHRARRELARSDNNRQSHDRQPKDRQSHDRQPKDRQSHDRQPKDGQSQDRQPKGPQS